MTNGRRKYHTKKQQKRAASLQKMRWEKENTKRILIKLMLKSDADVIDQLNKQDNMTGYIKSLIREDIKKES